MESSSRPVQTCSDIGVEYWGHLGDDADVCHAAWVSSNGARKIDGPSGQRRAGLLRSLVQKRHGVPFEHCVLRARVHAPIKVFREWHRHRVGWSYSEESGRYKQLDPVFYVPPPERPLVEAPDFKPMSPSFVPADPDTYKEIVNCLCRGYFAAWVEYEKMLERRCDKGLARDPLGVGIYSSMIATCNLRSLMHFLELRTQVPEGKATRPSKPLWEINRAACKLEAIFAEHFPDTHALWHENGRMAP